MRLTRTTLSASLLTSLALAGCATEPVVTPASAETTDSRPWPRFRGRNGQGITQRSGLPVTWSDTSPNVRWSTELTGKGNSSPIAAGGRVFLTATVPASETDAGDSAQLTRIALAFDEKTGQQLWRTDIFTGPEEKKHVGNTSASASAVSNGHSVWVYFGSHAARLDAVDGTAHWIDEVDANYLTTTSYGIGSSPILDGNRLIIFQDKEGRRAATDRGWLAAFNAQSGEVIWRRDWDDNCCAYSTPSIWTRGEIRDLVVPYSGRIAAHDPTTGEPRWEHEHYGWQFVNGVNFKNDVICVIGGAHHEQTATCLRAIDDEQGTTTLTEVWKQPHLKGIPTTSTPVWYQGRIFSVSELGVVLGRHPDSGKIIFRGRIGAGVQYRASLIAGDGKLYAAASSGTTAVIDVTKRKFTLLAVNDLEPDGDLNGASLAFGDDCLLVRRSERLYCIEGQGGQAAASTG